MAGLNLIWAWEGRAHTPWLTMAHGYVRNCRNWYLISGEADCGEADWRLWGGLIVRRLIVGGWMVIRDLVEFGPFSSERLQTFGNLIFTLFLP